MMILILVIHPLVGHLIAIGFLVFDVIVIATCTLSLILCLRSLYKSLRLAKVRSLSQSALGSCRGSLSTVVHVLKIPYLPLHTVGNLIICKALLAHNVLALV